MAADTTPETQTVKKSRKGMVIAVTAVLVLAGGGGAAYWFMRPAAAPAESAKPEPEPEEAGGIVAFEPFVVNLADGNGARFLRVSVQLVVAGEESAAEIEGNAVQKVRLRSQILELLSEQKSDTLVTAEGKAALKTAISARASKVLQPHKVIDVLFSDFIVQF